MSSTFCAHCGTNLKTPWTPPFIDAAAGGPAYRPYPHYQQRGADRSAALIMAVIIVAVLIIAVVAASGLLSSGGGGKGGDGTFTWTYDGRTYSISITIPRSLYDQARSDPIQRYAYTIEEAMSMCDEYVTPNDPVVREAAAALSNYTVGFSDLRTANFVLSFVQNIEYREDQISVSKDEYWRFPVETLYDEQGDCEDKAFLYASIMESMGYDAVILLYDGHAAAGIDVAGGYGTYYELDGKEYFYCETTAVGWSVGDIPDEYGSAYVAQVGMRP
jgi:transglutaminase-like putative cysteine protease